MKRVASIWHILLRFKVYVYLLIVCNNHLHKQFNFVNCITFVTLVYIRRDSLKII
jgi:hypothetical protein